MEFLIINSLTPPSTIPRKMNPKDTHWQSRSSHLQTLDGLAQQPVGKEPSSPSQTASPRLEVAQQSKPPIIYDAWMLLPQQPHQFFAGAAPCQKRGCLLDHCRSCCPNRTSSIILAGNFASPVVLGGCTAPGTRQHD